MSQAGTRDSTRSSQATDYGLDDLDTLLESLSTEEWTNSHAGVSVRGGRSSTQGSQAQTSPNQRKMAEALLMDLEDFEVATPTPVAAPVQSQPQKDEKHFPGASTRTAPGSKMLLPDFGNVRLQQPNAEDMNSAQKHASVFSYRDKQGGALADEEVSGYGAAPELNGGKRISVVNNPQPFNMFGGEVPPQPPSSAASTSNSVHMSPPPQPSKTNLQDYRASAQFQQPATKAPSNNPAVNRAPSDRLSVKSTTELDIDSLIAGLDELSAKVHSQNSSAGQPPSKAGSNDLLFNEPSKRNTADLLSNQVVRPASQLLSQQPGQSRPPSSPPQNFSSQQRPPSQQISQPSSTSPYTSPTVNKYNNQPVNNNARKDTYQQPQAQQQRPYMPESSYNTFDLNPSGSNTSVSSLMHSSPSAHNSMQLATVSKQGIAGEQATIAPSMVSSVLAFGSSPSHSFLSALENDIINEINAARKNPQLYADVIAQSRKPYFEGNRLKLPDSPIYLQTREGVKAVDECIKFLQEATATNALTVSSGMSTAAKEAATHAGATGAMRSDSLTRLKQHGKLEGCASTEIVAFGEASAREFVIRLLVGDGDPSRQQRNALLNSRFNNLGIAIAPHSQWKKILVIPLTEKFTEM